MSFTAAPNTPEIKINYITPSKVIAMLGNPATAISEACYNNAQGFTHVAFYALQNFDSGGVFSNKAAIAALIQIFNDRNIQCIGAFTGSNTLDALINYNNTTVPKFYGVISEIEFWNFSANLPWISQDASGNRSFYDTVELFKSRRAALTAANLQLITYNGWTKTGSTTSPSAIYDSEVDIISFDIAANKIVVAADYTILQGGKQFQTLGATPGTGGNQVIKIKDFPKAGRTTYFEVINVLPAFGNTELYVYPSLASCYSVPISNKLVSGGIATLSVTFGGSTAPYRLEAGDRVTISGLGAPYDGTFILTAVTGTSISYAVSSGNLTISGASGTAKLAYSSSTGSAVKLSYDVASIGTNQIMIHGDKTFRFNGINRVTRINVTDNGVATLFTVNGAPTYNAGTKLTTIPVVQSTAGLTSVTGFPVSFRGFADFDVGGKTNISYSSLFGFSSEQEQLYELVDLILIHIYTSIPTYSYARSRFLQCGLAGANTGIAKNVGFIISAEAAFSGPWFSGTGGAPKTVVQAYQYVVKNMAGTLPNQTGSPLYAQLESDANVNAWLNMKAIAIFKNDLLQAMTIGNGPNIYVNAGDDQTVINSLPGTIGLSGSWCDDGLGGAHTTIWTILSQPSGSPVSTLSNATTATPTLNYQRPGVYVVQMQVTDADGVIGLSTTNITVQSAVSVIVNADATAVSCYGLNDGEINSIVIGGTGPYVYVITKPGGFSATNGTGAFTGLAPGTYTLTVTDSLGATGTTFVTITEPAQIVPNLTIEQANCALYDPGITYTSDFNAVDWTINDGYSGLTIDQSTSLKVTTPGSFGSPYGFDATVNVPIASPFPTCQQILTLNFASIGTLVKVSVYADGGPATPPFKNLSGADPLVQTFLIPPSASNTLYLLFEGTETSALPKTIEINSITLQTDPTCTALPKAGTAVSVPTGGSGIYNFSWALLSAPGVPLQTLGSATTDTFIGAPDTYVLTITDNDGCEVSTTFVISQLPPLSVISKVTNAGCAGANKGSIDLTATGGKAPYSYQWTVGSTSTSSVITGLYAGTYTCEITDANGCVTEKTVVLTEFATGSVTIDGKRAFCQNEGLDLSSTVSGGAPSFSYKWFADSVLVSTNPGLSIPALSVGVVHTIELEVTDANGCIFRDTALVTFDTNTLPAITITSSTPPLTSCTGSSVTLTATEQGANTVNWECIETSQSFGSGSSIVVDNLYFFTFGSDPDPLTFKATITNGNCSSQATISVPYPVAVNVEIDLITPNVCGGSPNAGAIDINVINGCAPYTFVWTGPGGFTATTQNISGLINGTYSVVVSDALGNTTGASATIITSKPDVTNVVIIDNCRPGNHGSIEVIVDGGTLPYTYAWTGPNGHTATGSIIYNLAPGNYTVVITDDNGCIDTHTYSVINSFLSVEIVVQNIGCDGSDGILTANVTGGNTPVTYLWSTGETTQSISVNTPGNYSVVVSCADGCSVSKSAFVPAVVGIQVTISAQNPSTDTSSDGWANANVTGGSGIYTVEWSNGASTLFNNNLEPGSYIVTVTDFNGCIAIKEVVLVAVNAPPVDPKILERKKYACCAANIAYLAAIAERTGSEKQECLQFQSQFISAIFAVYCDMNGENSTCLTEEEKLKVIRILDEVCNQCKDCQ